MQVDVTVGTQRQREALWCIEQVRSLPTEHVVVFPSEWAEKKRYLPKQVTARPGYYRYESAPYLREIIDCLGPQSDVVFLDYMKGVQIGATVGVIENLIGYYIEHVKDAPMLMVMTDADLARLRVDKYIIPMLEYSDLYDLLQSTDSKNKHKKGVTRDQMSWHGGGFLLLFGANSPGKLRSTSIQILLEDEVDSYVNKAGKDGKPGALAEDRTTTYGDSRKIFRTSTPLLTPISQINKGFLAGDQRRYYVPCKGCGKAQYLVWHKTDKETGVTYGIHYKTQKNGTLIPGSVRYLCKYCQYEHIHADIAWWYRDNGRHCEWVPHAEPDDPKHRSYHTPAMYSAFETWEAQVRKWIACYDTDNNQVKDDELFQQFYNNTLGEPFTSRGEQLTKERVELHRRYEYSHKTVPNKLCIEETGDPIFCLVMTCDVHKTHLDVFVAGFTVNKIMYGIEWLVLEGDCENITGGPWQRLQKLKEEGLYISDDGKVYPIAITLVDSGYNSDIVYEFCNMYPDAFPIAGRDQPQRNARVKEFQEFTTSLGTVGFNIVVNIYKDRCANALRRERPVEGNLPQNNLSFPREFPQKYFDQLCKERKVKILNPRTGQIVGYEWHRPGKGDNHSWDLLIYACAGYDIIAADICFRLLEEQEYKKIEWDVVYNELRLGLFWVEQDEEAIRA